MPVSSKVKINELRWQLRVRENETQPSREPGKKISKIKARIEMAGVINP